VSRGGEALDRADLGDDQQRQVAPDAADLTQHLDALVVLGALIDVSGERVDLAVKVADQPQQHVKPCPWLGPKLEFGQKRAAAGAEQLAVAMLDALAGDQRVHAILQRGSHLRQDESLAQQVTQVAQLARGDVGLGQ
jgi:hypothetical protein